MGAAYFLSADAVSLSAATAKSVLELGTSSAVRIKIVEWWVECQSVTASDVPIKVEVGRFSAAVTTATAASEKMDLADGTPATTAKHSTSTEGAGTADDIMFHRISPTTGMYYVAPLGRELIVPVSAFWRMRVTATQAQTCTFGVVWEE